jgi:hypothetical protein
MIMNPEPAPEPALRRLNSTPLLNRKAVRALLLQLSRKRAHKFTRVSNATLEMINARVKVACMDHVGRVPSMGKTL